MIYCNKMPPYMYNGSKFNSKHKLKVLSMFGCWFESRSGSVSRSVSVSRSITDYWFEPRFKSLSGVGKR
jgi:hypothetical protein